MEQHRFIFFDSSSGEILATHTHVSVEGQGGPPDRDELRKLYRSFPGQDVDPDRLDVLNVDIDLLGRGLSSKRAIVDTATRRIVWPENGDG
jgi:hypothetical protein